VGLAGLCEVGISTWKADIDAAFRRVPLCPAHRRYGHICFKHQGRVLVAEHYAMMFGSVASVHNWDRVGTCAYPLCGCGSMSAACYLGSCLPMHARQATAHVTTASLRG